jgi:hypothetical protein
MTGAEAGGCDDDGSIVVTCGTAPGCAAKGVATSTRAKASNRIKPIPCKKSDTGTVIPYRD